jgi:ribosomal protein S18 acetylase RimI-like enzyme
MPIKVERITDFKNADLDELCQATQDAIRDGIGFNWITPPSMDVLESYYRGTLVVPERILFTGRLDGTMAASIQLLKPPPSRQLAAFSCTITNHFVAPWARGHGLARMLLQAAQDEAAELGFSVITLSVRATQEAAIRLYEESGYVRWGILPYYESVNDTMIAGHFFYKNLKPIMKIS